MDAENYDLKAALIDAEEELGYLRRIARAAMALNDGIEGEATIYRSLVRELAEAIADLPDDLDRELRADS